MATLTKRESEVLERFGYGMTNGDIAEALGLSPKTVSTYRTRLLEKLNLRNTPALIRYAILNGLSPVVSERDKLAAGGDDDLGH